MPQEGLQSGRARPSLRPQDPTQEANQQLSPMQMNQALQTEATTPGCADTSWHYSQVLYFSKRRGHAHVSTTPPKTIPINTHMPRPSHPPTKPVLSADTLPILLYPLQKQTHWPTALPVPALSHTIPARPSTHHATGTCCCPGVTALCGTKSLPQ